jgi:hypothetical protein
MRKGLTHSEAGKLGYEKSKNVLAEQKNKRVSKYNESPQKCTNCAQDLSYSKRNNKFCSKSCSASYNNRGVRRHGCAPSNCLNCDSLLSKSSKSYCNNRCQNEYQWKEKKNLIEEGKIKDLGKPQTQDKNLKKYLIDKNGEKCMQCGWCKINTHTNKIPIQIDHIDGNPQNQTLSNVRLLCPNCHALTPYYGSRGSGRPWRTK